MISRLMRADLWDAVKAGKLKLPIDMRFPLDQGAGGACPHAREQALRQDRADDVSAGSRERAAYFFPPLR